METYPAAKSKNEQLDSSFIYNRAFPTRTKEAIRRATAQSRILAWGLLQRHLFPFSQKATLFQNRASAEGTALKCTTYTPLGQSEMKHCGL